MGENPGGEAHAVLSKAAATHREGTHRKERQPWQAGPIAGRAIAAVAPALLAGGFAPVRKSDGAKCKDAGVSAN